MVPVIYNSFVLFICFMESDVVNIIGIVCGEFGNIQSYNLDSQYSFLLLNAIIL